MTKFSFLTDYPCPAGYLWKTLSWQGYRRCYKFSVDIAKTQTEAQELCKMQKSKLTTVSSLFEIDFLGFAIQRHGKAVRILFL